MVYLNWILDKLRTPLASKMSHIEVYSSSGCKYCRIAKAKLSELKLKYINIDIHDAESLTEEQGVRRDFAKGSTVPQIYVGSEHVGGCTELLNEVDAGRFDERLNRNGIVMPDSDSHTDNNSTVENAQILFKQCKFVPQTGENLNSLRFISKKIEDDKISALDISKTLQQRALKLMDSFVSPDGSKVDYLRMSCSADFASYVELTCQLQYCALTELASFNAEQKIAFYANLYNAQIIHANCVLRDHTKPAEDENNAGGGGLTPEQAAAMQAFYSGGTGAVYKVGGSTLSGIETEGVELTPDVIEHAILRANYPHPNQVNVALAASVSVATGGNPQDARYYYETLSFLPSDHAVVRLQLPLRRKEFDARIHFIVNCGARSCPPIRILQSSSSSDAGAGGDTGNVDQALASATAGYLHSEVRVDEAKREILLPRLLLWYGADFGVSLVAVLRRVCELLSESSVHKPALLRVLGAVDPDSSNPVPIVLRSEQPLGSNPDAFVVDYNPYNWGINSA